MKLVLLFTAIFAFSTDAFAACDSTSYSYSASGVSPNSYPSPLVSGTANYRACEDGAETACEASVLADNAKAANDCFVFCTTQPGCIVDNFVASNGDCESTGLIFSGGNPSMTSCVFSTDLTAACDCIDD